MTFKFSGLLAAFLVGAGISQAQPLAAYVTNQQQVMVWDNGIIRKIDYMRPVSLQTGRTAIPYLDNTRSFKIYYAGGVQKINNGFTNAFQATDNLVTFLNARSLNVFEDGKITNLTLLCDDYLVGDSLVLFLDGVRNEYKAYYDGGIYPIENFLAAQGLSQARVSDNIAAYVNYASQFRIFYHGEIIAQEEYAVNNFSVGRNTVAYVDVNRQFKVFHKGRTRTLEDFEPMSYAAGDDLVAYRSNDGYFKIYYNDSLYNLGYFDPSFSVGDHVVAFTDNTGFLQVFYKGDIITLDNYFPQNFIVQYNSLAYVDRNNMLRVFTGGEVYDVNAGSAEEWELNYDVLKYRIGQSLYRIFYKGREY